MPVSTTTLASSGRYGTAITRMALLGSSGRYDFEYFEPGGSLWDVSEETHRTKIQPKTWVRSVTSSPVPISALVRSSVNTTYTKNSVLDASAWDLSNVKVGYLIITSDGYIGPVISIGANSLGVLAWYKGFTGSYMGSTDFPSAGATATVHHRLRAKAVTISSISGNTFFIYVGCNNPDVTDLTGHPISFTMTEIHSRLTVRSTRERFLNLSQIWIISIPGQNAVITVDEVNSEEE